MYNIPLEDAEYIYSKLKDFISIGINVYWKPMDSIDSVSALNEKLMMYNNKSTFINYLIENNLHSNNMWDFGYVHENAELARKMNYPWNYKLSDMIVSYITHNIEKSDFERYFELLNKNLLLVRKIVHDKYEECHGSPKWIESAKTLGENIKKYLNFLFKKKKVIDYSFDEGSVEEKYASLTYTFSDKLDYQCKRKIIEELNNRLLSAYLSVDPSLSKFSKISLERSNYIQIKFDDCGYKCASASKVYILLKSNKWQSLGMPDEAQFVPKLGMKRKIA